ncbi:MAG: ATP-binding protein [Pseudomonadota bacterium]
MTRAIALLGAESTGKTELGAALTAALSARGQRVALVPEVLRLWCEAEGRTPRPDEQQGIATEQARRVESLLDGGGATPVDVVVADTTPLMTALYSELLFGDRSLYPFALAHQRRYHRTLLTGLDLPWVADGLQRDGPHVREPVDTMLRRVLGEAGIAFQMVYGIGEARLRHALDAIGPLPPTPGEVPPAGMPVRTETAGAWCCGTCGTCGDADCEHRLFTRLRGR